MGLDMNMYKVKLKKEEVELKEFYDYIRGETTIRLNNFVDDYNKISKYELVKKHLNKESLNIMDNPKEQKKKNDILKLLDDMYEDYLEDIEKYNAIDKNVIKRLEDTKIEEIAYWRKHSDLNGYFEDLYYERGGTSDSFNCENLYLDKEDIKTLIELHEKHLRKENSFEEAVGFFWGKSNEDNWKDSLQDFKKILKETDWENETVYYSCWW